MEKVVDELLGEFERGRLSRRQLVQRLALGMGAAALAPALPAAAPRQGLKAVGLNHISYQVADYARTRDFYAELLGMQASADTGTQCTLGFGKDCFLMPRQTRHPEGKAWVDHIAYTIEDWDRAAVEDSLRSRGLDPQPDTAESFHVFDPDGYRLQIASNKLMYVP